MGGLSAAYADGAYGNVGQSVNFGNPATFGTFYMTTFDLGVTIDGRTLRSQSPGGKFNSTNFIPSYLSLGLPLNRVKGWGMAFGLKPLSKINYSVHSLERTAGDSLQTLYEGSGGMNQVFVGVGKTWKKLSLGFSTGYNFGNKEISTKKNFINDTVQYYSSNSATNTSFGGMFFTGGLQYEITLSQKINSLAQSTENYLLRFGFSGTLQQNLNATLNTERKTFTNTIAGDVKVDSIFYQENVKGTIELPGTYAAGITFHKTSVNSRGSFEMWSIGAEYTSAKWSKYRFYGQPDRLADSWQFKLGAQFTPNPFANRVYWNVVNYRAGVFIGKDYLDPDGNGLKQFGVSFGAGLPLRKWNSYNDQFTVINTAMQFGKRGSSVNNVTESYIQFSLGFSLSDIWFVKRKYD